MKFKFGFYLIAAFFMLSLVGCSGLSGQTKIIAHKVNLSENNRPIPMLKASSVTLEKDGTRLEHAGTPAWGEFNKDGRDLDVLKKSIQVTLDKINKHAERKDGQLNLYIIIRRHFLAHSNNAGAVIACVAWCTTNENQKILFEEQFYAASKAKHTSSIGNLKNTVNKRIIARISETTLKIAQEETGKPIEPVSVEHTSNDISDLIKILPDYVQSWSNVMVFDGGNFFYLYSVGGSGQKIVEWYWAVPTEKINWEKHIK